MDYLKYFKNDRYQKSKNDCWTLLQDIYRDEEGIELPDIPIFEDEKSFVRGNIKHKKVDKAHKGVAVHVSTPKYEHIGYALNDKEYIHKTINQGVKISPIPKNADLYEVIND